jgi:hypothetical protein
MQYTKEQCQELINEILPMFESDAPIMFEHALSVKKTPHNELCRLYGVAKLNETSLTAFDGEKWYDIQPEQNNVGYVLQSIKQRLIGLAK